MIPYQKKDTFNLFMGMTVCLCEFMCTKDVQCLQKPEEGVRASRTGVTGSHELTDVGAGN